MGFLDRMISNAISTTVNSASRQIGDAVGNAAGNAISSYAKEATDSLATDMKIANQEKKIAMEKRAQFARHEMEDADKAQNLPPNCPHCGAPTNKKLVCEYCDCKVIE